MLLKPNLDLNSNIADQQKSIFCCEKTESWRQNGSFYSIEVVQYLCPKFLAPFVSMMEYLGAEQDLSTVLNVYSSEALDPHVNRERFREGLWS